MWHLYIFLKSAPLPSKTWGEMLWKKQSPHFLWTLFSRAGVHKMWGLCFGSQHFPPCLGLCFFRAEMLELLKDKISLVCRSQGSGYSLKKSSGGGGGQTMWIMFFVAFRHFLMLFFITYLGVFSLYLVITMRKKN